VLFLIKSGGITGNFQQWSYELRQLPKVVRQPLTIKDKLKLEKLSIYIFLMKTILQKLKKVFLINRNCFQFDYDFQSYKTPKNRKNIIIQKTFEVET
jgi:hypothetical protein